MIVHLESVMFKPIAEIGFAVSDKIHWLQLRWTIGFARAGRAVVFHPTSCIRWTWLGP
jgi:hypothetical protein